MAPGTCHLEARSDGSPGAQPLSAAAAQADSIRAMMDFVSLPFEGQGWANVAHPSCK